MFSPLFRSPLALPLRSGFRERDFEIRERERSGSRDRDEHYGRPGYDRHLYERAGLDRNVPERYGHSSSPYGMFSPIFNMYLQQLCLKEFLRHFFSLTKIYFVA